MPSFDVVSELDKHEVTNAVENAVKELDRRLTIDESVLRTKVFRPDAK